jgi:ubiquinone/menaquinone biosynthesis C-methylase UbiE
MMVLAISTMLGVALAVLALGVFLAWRRLEAVRASRRAQHDLLYGLGWGDTTTNNYGFAPSAIASPERFQLQMYDELRKLLEASPLAGRPVRLLEISCGRGGGLSHLTAQLSGPVRAVGLDFSRAAISFCARHYRKRKDLRFAMGDALHLPFDDDSFDAVVNVEASNHFGEGGALFEQVQRVLRPGGVFLYADSRIAHKLPRIQGALKAAGLEGELRDITENVRRACEEDTPRRLRLVRAALPWAGRMLLARRAQSYAGVTGSRMYEKFRTRKRVYFMGCAVKRTDAASAVRAAG